MDDNNKPNLSAANKCAKRILGGLFCVFYIALAGVFGRHTDIKQFYWASSWKFDQVHGEESKDVIDSCIESICHGSRVLYEDQYNAIHKRVIDVYGLIQRWLDKKSLSTGYMVCLENNQLTFLNPQIPDESIELFAQKTQRLYKELERQNIPFLFVMFPYKIHKEVTYLPRGVTDYSNSNADRFLQYIESNGVPVIDTRLMFINNPDKHYQLFYSGDHHWTPEYAYLTYRYLSDTLQRDGLPEAKFFSNEGMDLADMMKIKHSHPFDVPSQEKLIGKYYLNKEEYTTFIVPKYKTHFTVTEPSCNLKNTGDIKDVLMLYYHLPSIVHIQNHLASNRNRVVLISDSYSLSFIHFISLSNYQVDYITPWEYNDNLYEYIQTVQPDFVIFAINPLCIKDTTFQRL